MPKIMKLCLNSSKLYLEYCRLFSGNAVFLGVAHNKFAKRSFQKYPNFMNGSRIPSNPSRSPHLLSNHFPLSISPPGKPVSMTLSTLIFTTHDTFYTRYNTFSTYTVQQRRRFGVTKTWDTIIGLN